ncbi:threonine/serine dehydratase [bacterium]|nr:threonine/serine dehydratase [bacterium]
MVALADIQRAQDELPEEVVRTPLLYSGDLSDRLDVQLYLKAENLQVTGSYKSRAAYTILNNLSPEHKNKGAAISSSGNFAGAFAFMARLLKIPASIVMMQNTAPFKVQRTKNYGAEVVLCENRFEARWETLDRLEEERGIATINTFEAPDVIAGHGTIGLEILEDAADADTILVPISSGGLLAGVAVAVKELNPKVRIVGIQPEGCNAMYLSFQAQSLQSIKKAETICDALVATKPGALPFEHIMRYVDDVVVVSDEAVKDAVGLLFEFGKLVVEASGAVGIAAILSEAVQVKEEKVVALLSGGNVSRDVFRSLLVRS